MQLTSALRENSIAHLLQKKNVGLTLNLYQSGNSIMISKLVLNQNIRSHGVGSSVMEELCQYADQHGYTLILDSTDVFGATSIKRLQQFYKRFGFLLNKGATKNPNIKRQMYRLPQSK